MTSTSRDIERPTEGKRYLVDHVSWTGPDGRMTEPVLLLSPAP